MPRLSSASKDAYDVKQGFGKGYGEVLSACYTIYQYQPNKKTGEQQPPACFAKLTIQRYTDESFGTKTQDEPSEELLKVANCKKHEDGTYAFPIRPGNGDSRDDEDPEDCGGELGTEGNMLYVDSREGNAINKKVKYMVFMKSLEAKGWNPKISECSYTPDFVGMRAEFDQETMQKIDERSEENPTCLIVKRIFHYPYEGGAAKGTGAATGTKGKKDSKPTSTQTPSTVPSPGPASAPTPAASGLATGTYDDEVVAFASLAIASMSIEQRGAATNGPKLMVGVCSKAAAEKRDKDFQRALQKAMFDRAFLVKITEGLGCVVSGETITFPE